MKIKMSGKWIEITELGKHHFPGLLTALSNFDVRIGIDQLSVGCESNQQKVVDFLIAYCKIKEWEYQLETPPNYNECAKELGEVLKKHKLNLLPSNYDNSLGLTLSPSDNWSEGKYLCSWLCGN